MGYDLKTESYIATGIQQIKVPMGPSWKDLKHAQLLDPRQREEDKKWDKEFQRRREELKEQRRTSEEKR